MAQRRENGTRPDSCPSLSGPVYGEQARERRKEEERRGEREREREAVTAAAATACIGACMPACAVIHSFRIPLFHSANSISNLSYERGTLNLNCCYFSFSFSLFRSIPRFYCTICPSCRKVSFTFSFSLTELRVSCPSDQQIPRATVSVDSFQQPVCFSACYKSTYSMHRSVFSGRRSGQQQATTAASAAVSGATEKAAAAADRHASERERERDE